MDYRFKNIWIDKNVDKNEILNSFLKKSNSNNVVYASKEEIEKNSSKLSFREGKRTLIFTKANGRLLKECQGMVDPYLCCNLWTLNLIVNCPINCAYCFLQFYLNKPATYIFLDIKKALNEVEEKVNQYPKSFFRITTGELSDSLALEPELTFSAKLVETFKKFPNALLELKTKTVNVDHLLGLEHGERTVISWSVNTQQIIDKEEKGSASLKKRLKAANKAQRAGFLIGFHFDPIIYYPSWESDYAQTINEIFNVIDKNKIAWISLGTLRFVPGLEREIIKGFPKSKLPYSEFIKAIDGKMRYVKPIRLKLYQKLYEYIKSYGGEEVFVYLCMELKETWKKVMGFTPSSISHLNYLFAEKIYERFPNLLINQPFLSEF